MKKQKEKTTTKIKQKHIGDQSFPKAEGDNGL